MKTAALKKMPKPTDKKAVQRFLGFVNYLARYTPKLSDVCKPLRVLTEDKVPWIWDATHDQAFDEVVRLVTTAVWVQLCYRMVCQ